jgi:allantoin racemase
MAVDGRPARIWYQSFIDEEAQAPYFERLRARFARLAAPGTTVDVHGMSPPDRHFHPITEFRGADQTIRNALKARDEGYDAFVIGHFTDVGLQECRGLVDIPVIALGESNLLYACTLGRKIGLVTINPVFVPIHEAQIVAYGLTERVIGVRAVTADVGRFMKAYTDDAIRNEIRKEFEAEVTPFIEAGADVLIPSGGMPMLLFAEMQPFTVAGAAVLEGLAAALKAAEMAVALHRITGISAGRSGMYRLASKGAIEDYLSPRA